MIAADKNRLKATLTQGVMQIQNKLIVLYTSNLNAIAGQTALIAGFAYTGYIEVGNHMPLLQLYMQIKYVSETVAIFDSIRHLIQEVIRTISSNTSTTPST